MRYADAPSCLIVLADGFLPMASVTSIS